MTASKGKIDARTGFFDLVKKTQGWKNSKPKEKLKISANAVKIFAENKGNKSQNEGKIDWNGPKYTVKYKNVIYAI